MTNPYQQQHGSSHFASDSLASGGLPPLNARRPSYASVVSGNPSNLARQVRSGFSHLLNPSPDSEHHAYARFSTGFDSPGNGASGEEGSGRSYPTQGPFWPLGSPGFPYFSRAFDLYTSKDTLFHSCPTGPEDVRFSASNTTPNITGDGFLSPSYLRGTVYLQRLALEHRQRLLAERDSKGPQPPSTTSSRLATNGSSSHLPIIGAQISGSSHRGVAYDIVENPMFSATGEDKNGSARDETVTPLPSRWNKDDKDPALEVLGDGCEVRHTGRQSSDHEASAVRADHWIPPSCGVYYFEVTVLNTRKDHGKPPIAIGFASKEANLARAPGWEPESWGYHGDDGHSFASQNVGKPYAEQFGVGDTVGCLINFRLGHALFTKNGKELPIAFKDISFKEAKGKVYPIVGLKKKEDHVMANFGQRPFAFDIDGYMKRQKDMIEDEIRAADTSRLAPGLSETDLVQQLVLQFLQHDGYVATARAFAEELQSEKAALRFGPQEPVKAFDIRDDEDANNRQRIRRAILEGDIDRAVKYTDAYYPAVLRDNEQVYFHLRCRKFIEMIRKEAELNMLLEERRNSRKQGRAVRGDDDEEMLDPTNDDHVHNNDMDTAMTEDEDEVSAAGLSKLSQDALAYGMELRAEFREDPRRETARQLDEIFSLIAYPNPLKVKEVAHLLDGRGRVVVAEEVNAAILRSLGKSSRAALENVYTQTTVLLEDLRRDGGDGAFVTMENIMCDIAPSYP
ncbi:hypothetical protein VTI74DRAFT_5552 [Chaetomium olivicolor]